MASTPTPAGAVALPEISRGWRGAWLAPLILLGVSLSLTALICRNAEQRVERGLQADFEHLTTQINIHIQDSLSIQERHLRSTVGLFQASDEVSRKNFGKYFESIQSGNQDLNFLALVHLKYVSAPQLAPHIAQQRRQVGPDYQVMPPGVRDFYTPISYIMPATDGNQKIIGFDSSTNPAMRTALMRARDTAQIGMTTKVTLRQDEGSGMPGFVLYLPTR
jgi:CHASE1-domain containing sensor protein